MVRPPSLIAAQERHDAARKDRRVVLRLSEGEADDVKAHKDRSETPAEFFRRLLAEHVTRRRKRGAPSA